ncbi:MAG: hypothetical protein LBU04_01990 [Christensenellaceae bacterium]|jgi:hypothetical protein|nr:hypothetical protein [Christensenellaceae bacterium]
MSFIKLATILFRRNLRINLLIVALLMFFTIAGCSIIAVYVNNNIAFIMTRKLLSANGLYYIDDEDKDFSRYEQTIQEIMSPRIGNEIDIFRLSSMNNHLLDNGNLVTLKAVNVGLMEYIDYPLSSGRMFDVAVPGETIEAIATFGKVGDEYDINLAHFKNGSAHIVVVGVTNHAYLSLELLGGTLNNQIFHAGTKGISPNFLMFDLDAFVPSSSIIYRAARFMIFRPNITTDSINEIYKVMSEHSTGMTLDQLETSSRKEFEMVMNKLILPTFLPILIACFFCFLFATILSTTSFKAIFSVCFLCGTTFKKAVATILAYGLFISFLSCIPSIVFAKFAMPIITQQFFYTLSTVHAILVAIIISALYLLSLVFFSYQLLRKYNISAEIKTSEAGG